MDIDLLICLRNAAGRLAPYQGKILNSLGSCSVIATRLPNNKIRMDPTVRVRPKCWRKCGHSTWRLAWAAAFQSLAAASFVAVGLAIQRMSHRAGPMEPALPACRFAGGKIKMGTSLRWGDGVDRVLPGERRVSRVSSRRLAAVDAFPWFAVVPKNPQDDCCRGTPASTAHSTRSLWVGSATRVRVSTSSTFPPIGACACARTRSPARSRRSAASAALPSAPGCHSPNNPNGCV